MSDSYYITEQDGENLSFNYSYKQTFFHDVKGNRGLPEYAVIAQFMAESEENRVAILETLLFVQKFAFASTPQIEAMLKRKGIAVDTKELLNKCVQEYLLNYFIISKFDLGEIPEDAFKVYCLDTRATFILSHFSTADVVSWFSTDNFRCIELVTKYMATGSFYTELLDANKNSMKEFTPLFNVNIGRRMMRFSAMFSLVNGYTPLNYVFEVVRSYDLPGPWQKKVSEQVSIFDQEKCWHRYFDIKPCYVFLVENDEQGLEVSEIFYRLTGNKDFLILTDDMLKEGLMLTPLLAYDPESKDFVLGDKICYSKA